MSSTPPGPSTPSGRRRASAPGRSLKAGPPPRRGIRGFLSPRNLTWRRGLAIAGAFVALIVLVLSAMVAYAAMTLPDLNDLSLRTGTIKILDRNGNLIAEVSHDSHNVTTVNGSQISPFLKCATISAEDRNFYSEGAFDVPRVLKALFVDVIARRPEQGASTITQQLAKQAFFLDQNGTAEKSPLRKLREALVANELNSKFSKDQILTMYLNLIFYGENSYGIENASLRFFGVHAKDLDLAKAALLAGLPQAPSLLDPYVNPSQTWARMHYVIQGMVPTCAANQQQLGITVTQAQADAVDPLVGTPQEQASKQQALVAMLAKGTPQNLSSDAPHFVQYILNQLPTLLQDNPSALSGGNLTVTTTLDLPMQRLATQSVQSGVAKLSSRQANNGAMLMIDASNGQIITMVGSADFNNTSIAGEYNVVTGARQPGSSFKPYVYETAFRNQKVRPDTIEDDTYSESQHLGGVQDFDRSFMGPMTAAKGLLLSRNVVAEQVGAQVGMNNVIDFAQSLGITSPLDNNLSTAIGSSAVRMIDHAGAYAAFANGGQKVTPFGVLKITDDQGDTLVDNTNQGPSGSVMAPAEAGTITNILKWYPHYWGMPFDVPVAGKSGTTDNFNDAWFMAYTPQYVVATWVGHTEAAHPGELPMNQVYGIDEGNAIAVPFINALHLKNIPFQFVPGSLEDCYPPDASLLHPQHCVAPSTPSPSSTPTPSATPSPSSSATPTPLPFTPPPTFTFCATPAPKPSATASPGGPTPTPVPICP